MAGENEGRPIETAPGRLHAVSATCFVMLAASARSSLSRRRGRSLAAERLIPPPLLP